MPTLQCLSRDALKEYLSGWTDADQSDSIESHLTQCSDCEQTMHALENDPETLIEFVRNIRNQSTAETPVADSAIAYALSQSTQRPKRHLRCLTSLVQTIASNKRVTSQSILNDLMSLP